MKERPIYEIRVNVKDTITPDVHMYTEGKKYATVQLAHKYLASVQEQAKKSPYLDTNNLFNKVLHQKFVYPDKTVEIWMIIKQATLVEE